MRGLDDGFPSGIISVNGTRVRRWCPMNTQEQLRAYDGHHHLNCFRVLVSVDVCGLFCVFACPSSVPATTGGCSP